MAKMLIKGIQEKLDKLEKSNPFKYKTNGGKNKKKTDLCYILTVLLGSGSLVMR